MCPCHGKEGTFHSPSIKIGKFELKMSNCIVIKTNVLEDLQIGELGKSNRVSASFIESNQSRVSYHDDVC